MLHRTLLLAGLATALAQNTTNNKTNSSPDLETNQCQEYHSFIFRGSNEPYPGRPGPFISAICSALDASAADCGYENVVYPASLSVQSGGEPGAICTSMARGARNGQEQLREYAERCPEAKLILVGYSQGASVLFDVLGGGGGKIYDCVQEETPALDPEEVPGSKIAAAINFGAIRYTANQTFNHGSGKGYDGVKPREGDQLRDLQAFGPVLRAWCHFEDPVCAVESGTVYEQHWNYFDKHMKEGARWVAEMVREGGNGSSSGQSNNASGSGAFGNGGSSGESDSGSSENESGESGTAENAAGEMIVSGVPTVALVLSAMLLLGC